MAHQAIKYRLTADGTLPDFLCTEPNGLRGMYPAFDDVYPEPRNYAMVGISADGATGDFEVFATKDDLQSYLATVGADWYVYTDEYHPVEQDPDTWNVGKYPFDPAAAADQVWANLTLLNG